MSQQIFCLTHAALLYILCDRAAIDLLEAAFEFCRGEKQKIAFASVYAMNPQIYLLDEPASNLDMRSIQELGEHLRLIKSQGKTILIAEHRLYYLMDLVDRIVYLEPGKISPVFTPEALRQL